MSRLSKSLIGTALFLTALVAGTNAAYWLGEHREDDPRGTGNCAVLVLGHPTRADGTPDPIQGFRVEAGVEAFRRNGCEALVLSGGAAHNGYVEAETMAELARRSCVPSTALIVEGKSTTTWENIGCSTPLLRGYDRVLIVSESLHALRAKGYACRQDESLCDRVLAVGPMGPWDLWWWRVPAALYELSRYIKGKLIYDCHPERNTPICPV